MEKLEMKWIPVKERLPEEDGKFIVTKKYTYRSFTDVIFYSKNIKEWVDNNLSVTENPFEYLDEENEEIENISNLSGFFKVIDTMTDEGYVSIIQVYSNENLSAWMPYPEPYKED